MNPIAIKLVFLNHNDSERERNSENVIFLRGNVEMTLLNSNSIQ